MSTISEKLAKALDQLPYVNTVEHEQQDAAVSVLCRIRPDCGTLWAYLAEKILREADKYIGTPEYWHTHIARMYMIRNNKFVYGWTFVVMSSNPDKAIDKVSYIIESHINKAPRKINSPSIPAEPDNEDDDEEHRIRFGGDDDYTDAEGPLPKGAVPEADEAGNPIVPRSSRIHKIQMAGLPKNYDRNAPDPDLRKGSWNIESRKGRAFRPPVRN